MFTKWEEDVLPSAWLHLWSQCKPEGHSESAAHPLQSLMSSSLATATPVAHFYGNTASSFSVFLQKNKPNVPSHMQLHQDSDALKSVSLCRGFQRLLNKTSIKYILPHWDGLLMYNSTVTQRVFSIEICVHGPAVRAAPHCPGRAASSTMWVQV